MSSLDFSKDSFFLTMPKRLQKTVLRVAGVYAASQSDALDRARGIEHTSLTGKETKAEIEALCAEAIGNGHDSAAAVCIFGERVLPGGLAAAKEALEDSGLDLAAVNAFPFPQEFTAEQIYEEAKADIAAGAQHLDTVFDVLAFQDGDLETVTAKLEAVRRAVDEHNGALAPGQKPVTLKTIMQTAAFTRYDDLHSACILALQCGADYLKTSTGKENPYLNLEKDSATLPAGATLMQAADDFDRAFGGRPCKIKISGGVGKTVDTAPVDTERYTILMEIITGRPEDLRFGTSGGSLDSLRAYALHGPQAPAQDGPAPAGY